MHCRPLHLSSLDLGKSTSQPQDSLLWTGYEMGVREAMTTMSRDLGWTKGEWDAFEAAAQEQARKMIAEAE